MNKLEMQTMETRRLLRMTTTERANHERIKREILDARKPTAFDALWAADAADRFVGRFTIDFGGGEPVKVEATADPENPRRLDLKVTVQLAGNILETNEEIAVTPDTASLPDAQLILSAWDDYTWNDIVRRSVIGDEAFAALIAAGDLVPVKRPRDGTARDYVVAEGNILTCKEGGGTYHSGETLPDYVTAWSLRGHLTACRIVPGK